MSFQHTRISGKGNLDQRVGRRNRLYVQVLKGLPGARGVLVTAGGEGTAYCFRGLEGKENDSGFVSVFSVDVQDTTGAGDAYTCGFLAYLLAEV
jgi:sugar/nucleoside kinase (ribokinase family)